MTSGTSRKLLHLATSLCLASAVHAADSLRLVANRGQWPESIRHVGTLPGMLVRAERGGLALQLEGADGDGVLVRIRFEGAPQAEPEGFEELDGVHNFYLGNDPRRWASGVPAFARVRYRDVHPGIDLVVGSRDGRLKYDVEVAAGADLDALVLRLEGIEGIRDVPGESPVIETALGPLAHLAGESWEVLPSGERRPVTCLWRRAGPSSIAVDVPGRDANLPLVIDPELRWSTFLGGSYALSNGDASYDIAYDPDGYVVVTGQTDSVKTFPHTPGAFYAPGGSFQAAFVTKFDQDSGSLVYSSVFGGSISNNRGHAVAVGPEGQAAVIGITASIDFPTTPGSFDPVKDSGPATVGFVTELDASGALVFSSFLEPTANGITANVIAVDAVGGVLVAGLTGDPAYPTTPGVFQETYAGVGDGYLTRIHPSGSHIEWSTFLGGSGTDEITALWVAPDGEVTVAGHTNSNDFPTTPDAYARTRASSADIFISRLTPRGDELLWSTYFGGNQAESARAIDVSAGSVLVVGSTLSTDLPTGPNVIHPTKGGAGGYQGFVLRLDSRGETVLYTTYIGGEAASSVAGVAVDASGVATITGYESADDPPTFPTTPGAYDTTGSTGENLYVQRLSPRGDRLLYSTFLGSQPSSEFGVGLVASPTGRTTVTGYCFSPGTYPTTPDAFQPTFQGGQSDAVVTTLDLYLEGVEPTRPSIPGCHGPLTMNAVEMPVAGTAGFAVYCSSAPPFAQGELRILHRPLQGFAPIPVGSLVLHALGRVERIPITTDLDGYVETTVPLDGRTPGEVLELQYRFPAAAGSGAVAPDGPCTSNGLRVTVQ